MVAAAHAAAPGLTATRTVLYHAGALFRNYNDVDAVMLFATGGPTAAAARPTAAWARLRGRARLALGAAGRVSGCVSYSVVNKSNYLKDRYNTYISDCRN